ncbi:flagellar hook-associated protein FlgL [Ruegeria denitrificans]|uniref:Flagellar hook-associated protein FlgL n=1 Tax=Ruegeria denitrificans TaxID=1715692 RepID=A0A0P1IK63_9RHOB|nr:flagellin [Ruegeria denitrificans]CUK02900.1 flagellar hook-associated protein FlgL [Ruegeria denitrificans]
MINLTSIGDLARGMTLRTRSTELRNEIETLSYEMSTGKVQDVSGRLDGDYSHLLDLDRSLSRLDAYQVSTAEAGLFTDAMQLSLTTINESVTELTSSLLSFGTSNQAVSHENASVQARNELDTIISALNTRAGGRSLYSGAATDVSPLPSTDTLLTALEAELSGHTTTADIRQAAEDWFNDPAGFDAVIYQGSGNVLAPMQISENESVRIPITATDPAIKDAIRDTAVAALVSDDTLNLPRDQRTALFTQLGVDLANTQNEMVNLRAQVGSAEARIEQAATRNGAAQTSLEFSRNKLIAADPYETAAQLQTVQFQLESLYSVTVRNANLSLVNFLR